MILHGLNRGLTKGMISTLVNNVEDNGRILYRHLAFPSTAPSTTHDDVPPSTTLDDVPPSTTLDDVPPAEPEALDLNGATLGDVSTPTVAPESVENEMSTDQQETTTTQADETDMQTELQL